jgi:hypothetical protein
MGVIRFVANLDARRQVALITPWSCTEGGKILIRMTRKGQLQVRLTLSKDADKLLRAWLIGHKSNMRETRYADPSRRAGNAPCIVCCSYVRL